MSMDPNSSEKKPRRPRIGQQFNSESTGESRPHFDRPAYTPRPRTVNGESEGGYKRPYQPRQNNYGTQRPYQQRPYNTQGAYGQRPYQQRPYNPAGADSSAASGDDAPKTEGAENQGFAQRHTEGNQRPYQQRPYNNQGGYQQRPYNNNGPRQYNSNGPRQYNTNGPRQYNSNGPRQYNNNGPRQYNSNGPRQYNNNGPRPYNNNNNRRYNPNQRQQNTGFPTRGKSFTPRPKPVEYEMPIPDPNEQIRLNKYMSNAGLCSRREADEFITQGLVKVNGKVVTELGTKITHADVVEYDEKVVTLQNKCYILLNKPKDCVTTSDDPHGRLTVLDLVKGACKERIYPVGRLDRNTTGVLLLTNDGDLASKLTHPKFVKKKIYHVWTDRDIAEEDMQRIADGIELEDGPIHADAISYATETDRNQAGIEIHSGRNRIVRRIFESLGYHVTKLDRVYFAGLTKKNLARGRWRYLTQEEVNYLKMGSFE